MSVEIEIIARIRRKLQGELRLLLIPGRPVYLRSAPGRVDVLGGLTWQTGGTLAQMAVPHRAGAAVQQRDDGQIVVHHCDIAPPVGDADYFCKPVEMKEMRVGSAYATAWHEQVRNIAPGHGWVAPVLAAIYMLGQSHAEAFMRAGSLRAGAEGTQSEGASSWGGGFTIFLHSEVPPGANQANTTALVTSVLLALTDCLQAAILHGTRGSESEVIEGTAGGGDRWKLPLEAEDLALRVHRAVNSRRANHGQLIDAWTCLEALPGPPARLLRYSAQGHQLVGQVSVPKDLKIMALDTGVNYAAAGGSVEQLRLAGAMGLRIIETVYRDLGQRHTPLHGHLANLSPVLYRQYFRALLPRRLRGSDFLRAYEPLAEQAGAIVPERLYRVRAAVDHLLTEHEHAENFLQTIEELADPVARRKLSSNNREKIQRRAGRLLLASHHSYRLRVDLSCREADWLVDHLMESGPDKGIYGARMTGSGGGGTVVALLHNTRQTMDVLLETFTAYHQIIGLPLQMQEAGGGHAGGALHTSGVEITV